MNEIIAVLVTSHLVHRVCGVFKTQKQSLKKNRKESFLYGKLSIYMNNYTYYIMTIYKYIYIYIVYNINHTIYVYMETKLFKII